MSPFPSSRFDFVFGIETEAHDASFPLHFPSLCRAARLAAAASSTPSFDESNPSSLTPEQTAVLAKAKADALEKEGKKVRSVKRWFEKVKGEYEVAEKWLRGEYAEDEED